MELSLGVDIPLVVALVKIEELLEQEWSGLGTT